MQRRDSFASSIKPKQFNTTQSVASSGPGSDVASKVDPSSPKPAAPALDPHHIELVQVDKKIKVNKYDKHPNVKKRRDYREMLSLECTLECIKKEDEKYFDPGMSMLPSE